MKANMRVIGTTNSETARTDARNTCNGTVSCDHCYRRRGDITLVVRRNRREWLCGNCATPRPHPRMRRGLAPA